LFFVYGFFCFIISAFIFKQIFAVSFLTKHAFYGILNLFLVISLTLSSTLANIENTFIKQWLAAPFSLLGLFSLPALLFLNTYLPITIFFILILFLSSIIILSFALLINIRISNEKILTSTDRFLSLEGVRVED
jgi:hypothetical protein